MGIYNNHPKVFIDSNGRASGIMVDLLQEIATAEHWTLRFVPCAWSDCMAMLERGDIDLLPDVAYSEARSKRFSFHTIPALLSWSQLYRSRMKVDSILDLKDKRVAVLEGSVQAEYLQALVNNFGLNTRFLKTSSLDQSFALVRDGKADLAVANKYFGDMRASYYGLHDTPIVFQPARLFYAARRGAQDDVLPVLDRYLTAWQADSESVYFGILKRWQLQAQPQGIGARIFWILGLSAMLLLAASVAALRFRRQAKMRARELRDTENKLAAILDSVDSPVYIKDAGFRYLYANGALCRLLGLPVHEILGKDDFQLFGPARAAILRAHDITVMQANERRVFEESASCEGESRTYLSTKVSLALEGGTTRYLCGISSDITVRKQMEESLRVAATVFQSHEGMLVLGRDHAIIDANRAMCAMSGYEITELMDSRVLPFLLDEHGHGLDDAFWDMLAVQKNWQGEVWGQRKSDALYPALLVISAVLDHEGSIANYVCTVSDIMELKQTQERNRRLAYYDELTGLPNRRLLFERIQSCLAANSDASQFGALLFLDLDNFKDLNDTRGHIAGDQLLQQVARRLEACVRVNDTVARLGGDEFVIMLDAIGTTEEEGRLHAEMLAEKVLTAVCAPYEIGGLAHHASCSIGITLCAHLDESLDALMKRGDLAMYQAKAEGRNTLCFFEPWMEQRIRQRIELEAELRRALSAGQLALFYQPQVEAGRIVGAEALLRWRHPERGLIGPADFIAVAENTDLILPIGAWVMHAACQQLVRWSAVPHSAHLTVAVNISIRQLREDSFVRDTLDLIASTGANPAQLKLELTESMVIDCVEETIEKMEQLRRHGVSFSLDDFGTGYSSLAYLKRLPLEQLKIDRSFVRDILVDPNDASIARSVVALAQALGLSIIAEGVETEAQRVMLQELGCHRYQGYLFGRPVPVEDMDAMLGVSQPWQANAGAMEG